MPGHQWHVDLQLDLDAVLRGFSRETSGANAPAPEPPKNPTTKAGNVWALGEHRLVCGDACSKKHVQLALGGLKPALMVTDPPYGVDYAPGWRDGMVGEFGAAARVKSPVKNDDQVRWTRAYQLFAGPVAYVWHASWHIAEVAADVEEAGFVIRNLIVWKKQHFAISRGHYHWQHEPCWYAVRKGQSARWCGDRTQTTVWDISSLNPAGRKEERVDHSTQKPVECMARPIRNHGGMGDVVYDPFLGSGTTLIAAVQLERRCVALELDPAYCDVVVERWQNLTGGKALRSK